MAVREEASFGSLVRHHRRALGLTQEELAERAGLSERAVRDIERGGKHTPRKDTVQLLADALELEAPGREAFHSASRRVGEPELGGPVAPSGTRTNLPDEPTPFIGREREIAQVVDLLQRPQVRLITLTGTGGTGKTRLALRVAAQVLPRFEDGVFFVSLASLRDPGLVLQMMGEAMGIKEREGTSLLDTLKEHLQVRHLLLVLDNFEHLLEAAPLVGELLDSSPDLHILATSRIPLHLAREHEYGVPLLAVPDPQHLPALDQISEYDAVALFIERVQAVKASFTLTEENAPAVAGICGQLDGLPLAIELAAARTKLFPPNVLRERLSSRLKLLTGGARDLPARHQTLRAAIDWSYSLLSEAEQALFARLSVFAGGCTLEAAETVCNAAGDGEIEVLDGIAGLIDKGLLRQEEKEEPRFVMLETIREYAVERIEASGEREALRESHARYYLALTEAAQPQLIGPEEERWLTRLEEDLDNLRAALQWAQERDEVECGLQLASALRVFWEERGGLNEGRRWLETFLTRVHEDENAVSPVVRVRALIAAGSLADQGTSDDTAGRLLKQSLALSQELGDERLTAEALIHLGHWVVWWHPERAPELSERGLALARKHGAKDLISRALFTLGQAAQHQGDADRARKLYRESLTIGRTLGSKRELARLLAGQGLLMQRLGDLERARMLSEESLAIRRAAGDKQGMTCQFNDLAMQLIAQGDYKEATRLIEEGLALQRELGDDRGVAHQLGLLGWMAQEQGAYERAIALSEEGLELSRRACDNLGLATALLRLSDVARDHGDTERVTVLCEESLALLRDLGDRLLTGFALNNLALATRAGGDYQRARALLEETLSSAPDYWPGLSETCTSMGLVALDEEDWERAQRAFIQSLVFRATAGLATRTAAMDLEGLAGAAVRRGHPERAACLMGAASAIRARLGTPIWPVNRPSYERHLAAARYALGEKRFTAAWEEGQAMTLEEAIEYALTEDSKPGREFATPPDVASLP